MKNRFDLVKILDIIGMVLLIIGSVTLCYEKIKLFMFIITGKLFSYAAKENKRFGIYWISKLLGLVIAIVGFSVGIFVLLSKGY